ncbi:MAG: DNA polymerase, partial [Acidihalobacter sp.]
VPRPGWKLVSADYSQIELRLLAHVSGDAILSQSFRDGEDIHARTAAEVFQALPGFVDPELRRQAKAINFGIIYGMSAYGLSKNLDISQKMAQTYIDNYFARYQGVQAYMQATIAAARESGQTSTLLGRLRPLPDIHSKNHNLRQFAERIVPPRQRLALQAWVWLASRPGLYRPVVRVGVGLLRLLAGRRGRLRSLPLAGAWTQARDLPAPQGGTFIDAWHKGRR